MTGLSSPKASLAAASQKFGSPEIGPYSWLRPLRYIISSAFGKINKRTNIVQISKFHFLWHAI